MAWMLHVALGAPRGPTKAAVAPPSAQELRLLSEIDAIDRKLVRAETALAEGEGQVHALATALADAESARATANADYQAAMVKLGRRLGALTRLPPASNVALLSGVDSLATLVDDQWLLSAVAHHDRQLWAAHQATHQQLSQTIALTQERALALDEAQKRRRALRDALASRRQRKDRVVAGLRKRRSHKALGAELQLAQARLGQVVGGPSPASPRGRLPAGNKLPWPATGKVRLGFGQQTEGAFGTSTFHNGWDIGAAAGADVQAVAAGRVAYAQWLHGYGQVAIVEHPGGYHTVHAHLSRLHVQAGQRVRAGQLLGAVGDTGSLRGTVLYFEIRHRGVPQDPRLYLARR
jgi:septal ring factor EnvC (AmiA/AmiB activator)